MPNPLGQVLRLDAARVVDGAGVDHAAGAMLVEVAPASAPGARVGMGDVGRAGCGEGYEVTGTIRVLAVGRATDLDHHETKRYAKRIELGDAWLVPAFVNAHTHLDLTHLGPHDLDERGFEGFIAHVRGGRCVDDPGIAASVRQGVEMSRAGGVVAVGDIAGAVRGRPSLAAYRALRECGLLGISFLEFFAAGVGWEDRVAEVESLARTALEGGGVEDTRTSAPDLSRGVRLGLQPHAPYSVCRAAYARAIELAQKCGMSICTHVAESLAEREYIERAGGPFRTLMEGLGLWRDSMLDEYGKGARPIEHLREMLAMGPMLAVHLNDVRDAEIELLASLGTVTVVYCPRASDYFRAPSFFGPHRYRDMIRAGIRVVLGTDSIINLPSGTTRISTIDEVVHLTRRDGIAFHDALGMATWAAAEALGLDARPFRFERGNTLAGLVALRGVERTGDIQLRVLQLV
jgi:cytosine/adenosine deaminase-related metal-dependent hydrolase